GGTGQTDQNVEQGGLPAAGRPNHRHQFTLMDEAIHTSQCMHLDFAEAVNFLQVASGDYGFHENQRPCLAAGFGVPSVIGIFRFSKSILGNDPMTTADHRPPATDALYSYASASTGSSWAARNAG